MYTFKRGKEGEYKNCNESPVLLENSCKIDDDDDNLDTPMGKAFFVPDKDGCKSRNRKGILLGTDGKIFLYECERDDHQFTEWCGFSWASQFWLEIS
ncbi:uncharacterized protein APUU_50456S [Aspergillus puulaauensis]|uniref:Uncharacterized protein n=1 Tax=Aspergillus puulaauensis TaxID=1220207 RepID=A0A7R7XQF1_9EURO|nr:uncharacterized protein APUU_50456S [Aspergillus puulaauensis]BCS25745.1 hypothetical protein APUU_50456S [Aspergillus puulaauensis]